MKFLTIIILVFAVIFFILSEEVEGKNWTRCDQLPKKRLRFDYLVSQSPYFIYRAIGSEEQCAVGVATGLVKKKNVNFIISIGTEIVANRHMIDRKTNAYAIDCYSNATYTFQFFYSKKGKKYRFWCEYVCSGDGITLEVLRCYGCDSAGEAALQTYLDENVSQIPGYENVINSQENCTHTQNCPRFNN